MDDIKHKTVSFPSIDLEDTELFVVSVGRNPTPPPRSASWVTLTGLWPQAGIYKRSSKDYGINNGASAILV